MGVRTRHLDALARWKAEVQTKAAVAEAVRVVERWNVELAAGRDLLWSPLIRAAVLAGAHAMRRHRRRRAAELARASGT